LLVMSASYIFSPIQLAIHFGTLYDASIEKIDDD
jgi:hypothetical protein